jgi:outer membrane biosynthesis protein TonB
MRELAKALDLATSATVPLSTDSVRALVAAGGEASASTTGDQRESGGSTAVTSPMSLPVRRPLPWLLIALALGCMLGGAWILREQLGGHPESSRANASASAELPASTDLTTIPAATATQADLQSPSASATPSAPPVVLCEDKKAQPCAKDNEPWCDVSGKPLTCCVKGLVSTPQGRCVCAPGGVTNEALVTNGCKHAEPEYPPQVQTAIRAKFPDLRRCYEAALKQNPKLSGNVSIAFLIAPGGEFYRATIVGSSTPDPTFQDCLVGIFTKLRADPPPDGHMSVTYPLAFTPGE